MEEDVGTLPTVVASEVESDDPSLAPTLAVTETTLPVAPGSERRAATPFEGVLGVEQPGRYVEPSLLGAGGFGEVLAVFDTQLDRPVALKRLHGSARLQRELEQRFINEARITGKLEHPGIVPVYELGRRAGDDSVYYVMRLVKGRTMLDALEGANFQERLKLLPHFVDACHAVAYAHSRGVVHRDLKPENIMLGLFGETLVVDWGLAKAKGEDDVQLEALADGIERLRDAVVKTRAGSAMGTPAYMPPEQCLGRLDAIDERSDVYALGAVLYHIITGRPPFMAKTVDEVIRRTLHEPLVRPSERVPECPPELDAIARRALRRKRDRRYADAQELARDVRAFLDGGIVGAHRYSPWQRLNRAVLRHRWSLAAAALVVTVAAGTWVYRDRVAVDDARRAAHAALEDRFAANEARRAELLAKLEVLLRDTATGATEMRWLDTYAFKIVQLNEPVVSGQLEARLLHALVHGTTDVRRLAAKALGGLARRDAVPAMAARLAADGEQDEQVVLEIIHALGVIGDPRADAAVNDARWRAGQFSRLWQLTELAYRMIPLPELEDGGASLSADEWTDRGRSLVNKGFPDEALLAYTKALEREPNLSRALNNRAIVFSQRSRYEDALVDYTRAIELAKEPAERDKGLYNRAVLKRKMEDYEGAIADYTSIIEAGGALVLMGLRSRANAYRYVGKDELALADYARAIEHSPEDPKSHEALGSTYIEMGKVRRAIAAFDRALDHNKQSTTALVQRGYAHRLVGDHEAAMRDFTRVIELDPSNDSGRLNRAALAMSLGKREAALLDLSHCLVSDCGNPHLGWYRHAARAVVHHAATGQFDDALTDLEVAHQKAVARDDQVTSALLGTAVALRVGGGEDLTLWRTRLSPRVEKWWHERLLRIVAGTETFEAVEPEVFVSSRRCDLLLAAALHAELGGNLARAGAFYRLAEELRRPTDLSCAMAVASTAAVDAP